MYGTFRSGFRAVPFTSEFFFSKIVKVFVKFWSKNLRLCTPLGFTTDRLNSLTVAVFLHDSEELDDDFGAWSDQNLSLVSLFSVGDAFQAVGEGGHSYHFGL